VPVKLTLIARIVAACCRHAWAVSAVGLALGVFALVYSAQHFAMNTDSSKLISPDLPWRQAEAAYDAAFPQQNDLIVAVVDGATPELAEHGAATLAAHQSPDSGPFLAVRRPDGGPFFDHNGLLFLPVADVEAITQQLITAQPFLGSLAADPSLRGLMNSLSLVLLGVEQGQAKLEDMAQPLKAFADAFERIAEGQPLFFSWRQMITGKPAQSRELRRFVTIQPKLDYSALSPGAAATAAIRQVVQGLQLTPDHGVTVRLTGSVPLNDEEFATLAENAGLIAGLMMLAVLLMLWLAVRSARIILCILATLFVGGSATAALGLFAVGQFNLISVAFVTLFVGLGVDFGIQFSVRYRAERHLANDLTGALVASGATIGNSLALAAAATAAGFFAFLPTDYIGVSELGLIAGSGMIIAFLLSITLLPALLVLCHPPGEMREVGYLSLAAVDRQIGRHRRLILGITTLLGLACLAAMPLLRFDFNPINLKSPKVESVSTLLDLMRDPDTTPNTIDILSPSLESAVGLAEQLSALPEVARAITLRSFIPNDQTEKLALIDDASLLLDPTLNPLETKPPPTDAQTAQSMAEIASKLKQVAGDADTDAAHNAQRLAATLDRFAKGDEALRARAAQALLPSLATLLNQLRGLLQAAPVTLQNLPTDLVQDWITKDGRARIQLVPSGDSNDNATLQRFTTAVRAVAPDAMGVPISIQEASRTIKDAFIEAGILSLLSITALLFLMLRKLRDVLLTLIPILLTGLLTLGTCVLIGQPINFANIIVLPLLFGIGVAFNIYFIMAWRAGTRLFLQSSLTRAVLFSALTTASAFGSLWLSSHPGTASMGKLLMISLGWTLIMVLLFQPALLLTAQGRTDSKSPSPTP
jgi:hopanoid biosynthesis associated RND transporter like protein HpnN